MRLDTVAKRGSGHTPDKEHPEYWGGPIKWISLADSDRLDKVYISETAQTITPAGVAHSSAVVHPSGTVVLSRDAGIGKSAITTEEMAVSQHFIAWRCGPDLDNHFLYYWLQSKKSEFDRISAGSTIKTIGLPYFRLLEVPLPPLKEQRAIAAALSDVDALIVGLNKLIAKKRAIKLATTQQLLTGQIRLPPFRRAQAAGKQTARGIIPEDWDAPSLGELFTFKNGLNKGKGFFGYGTPIVNYMDVYENRGLTIHNLKGRVAVNPQELKSFEVRKGDVFFTRTSETAEEIGISSVMLDEPKNTVFSGFVLRARPKDGSLDDLFKKYCFSTLNVRQQIIAQTTETTRALTNGRYLSLVVMARPSRAEQRAIADVITVMDADIAVLERRRDKTKAIRQGIMQALLTGRIRLMKPEVGG